MPERIEVSAKEADQRLDKLLRQHFPHLSFGQTQKLIRGGRVRVDGKRAKAAARISAGSVLTLPYQGHEIAAAQEEAERAAARPGGRDAMVGDAAALATMSVYEDSALQVLAKPAGLAVQGGSAVTTHVAQMIEGSDLHLAHRLDRDTSGLLVLAKGSLNAKLITKAFADHQVQKTYLAIVADGGSAVQDAGRLDLPLAKRLVGGEGMMAIAGVDEEGQSAVTDFRVLGRTATGACLLALSPQTGRTHQLRVHAAHVFGGIWGDRKYGQAHGDAPALRLHAWQLVLPHPDTGEKLQLSAALPRGFEMDLARLGLDLPQEWSPA